MLATLKHHEDEIAAAGPSASSDGDKADADNLSRAPSAMPSMQEKQDMRSQIEAVVIEQPKDAAKLTIWKKLIRSRIMFTDIF